MLETNAMVSVSLHYWAGARAAAGVAEEQIEARSVAEALRIASATNGPIRISTG